MTPRSSFLEVVRSGFSGLTTRASDSFAARTLLPAVAASLLTCGSAFGNTASLQITALALDLQPATVDHPSASSVLFTTFAPDRVPLVEEGAADLGTSGELRPRAGGSAYEADFLVRRGAATLQYGSLTLNLPETDADGDGLRDFLQLDQAVQAEASGTVTPDDPAGSPVPVTATLLRGGGDARGIYTFAFDFRGERILAEGDFVLSASFPGASGTTYSRGVVNTLDFAFRMPDGEGRPGASAASSTSFVVADADTVRLSAFSFTDDKGAQFAITPTTLKRVGNRYAGIAQLADGSPATPWVDYRDWHVEIVDPNDADADGIPDLSDELAELTPVIDAPPQSVAVAAGGTARFQVVASGVNLVYQWLHDGQALAGATDAVLTLPGVTPAQAGQYRVRVSNNNGQVLSEPATLSLVTAGGTQAELVNLSVRARTEPGARTLIVSWAVQGATNLLVRGVGPELAFYNVQGYADDPVLDLYTEAGQLFARNSSWWEHERETIQRTSASVGAFALSEDGRDAALLVGVANGNSTAHVKSERPGVVLAEVYRASQNSGRLGNLAARGYAGAGSDTLIAGFVVAGSGKAKVLLRGVGPTLGEFQVDGVLEDPVLELFRESTSIALNDDWQASDAAAMASSGAFALPAGSRDAVIIATLEPGNYSVHVRGKGSQAGVALAEIYLLAE